MMNTTVTDSLLLFRSSFSFSREFKSPVKIQRKRPSPFKSRAKIIEKSSSSSSSSPTTTTSGNNSNQVFNRNGFRSLYGRRGLIFATTLPFILPLYEQVDGFGVNAAEVIANESFTIQEQVRKLLSKGKAPGVLRLVFHDAGTFDMEESSGGMNGSIVYELDRPENGGLKKSLKILEKVKSEVDITHPVSWADMIAVAGAEAVSICGGPVIPVQLGRLDSMVPDPEAKLPDESLDASGLKQRFLRKGFSTQELVVLSGAHTLGGKGFGNPTVFDNSYFQILLKRPWISSGGMSSMIGLPSDHALTEDDECLRWIGVYADDQKRFFEDFKNAYIKLVNSGARWKNV